MTSPKVVLSVISCFLTLLFSTAAVSAGIDAENKKKAALAQAHLERKVDEVLEIIRDPLLTADPPAQEKVLYDKGFEIFDFKTFSMLALGPKYKKFSPRQREDFILYFSQLISQTYFPKLAGQDVQNITIHYLDNRPLKPRKNVFRTDVSTELVRGETHVPIVYRMIRRENAEWKIYDIKIEGVSMAANYREQYRHQISLTPEEIITQLKEKVDQ